MKKSLFSLICCVGLINASNSVAQCVVGGTEFTPRADLCEPTMVSDTNEVNGWFNSKVDKILAKQCGKAGYYEQPYNVIQTGMPSNKISVMGDFNSTWEKLLKASIPDGKSTGFTAITSNPKLISPYLSEGSGSAMLVAMGNGHEAPFFTYSVSGLAPNSNVTMTVDVYDLLDIKELETALKAMNSGVKASTDYKTKIPLPYGGSYTVQLNAGVMDYKQGRIEGNISNQFSITGATTTNNGMAPTGMGASTTVTPTNGGKQLKISARADNTGAVSFYLWRNPGGNARPIGLDNLVVEGEILPVIKAGGNPCPMNPYTMRLSSTYPAGTTYSWKVAEDGSQTSDMPTFSFVPEKKGTYNVTCEVTLPGCKSAKSKTFTFETSENCCESADGTPLSLVNIYKNDFGQFVGSNYVYTDAKGNEYSVPVTELSYCGIQQDVIKDQLGGGSFSVTYNTKFCENGGYVVGTQDPYGNSGGDHTGNGNGGMLIMDLKTDGWKNKAIFKQEVKNLCKDARIYFNAAFQAINDIQGKAGNPTSVGTVELVLKSASGTVLASSDDVTFTKPGWVEMPAEIMLSKDETSVTLELISLEDDYTGDGRGDFAIDDISFQVCAPPAVDVTPNLTETELLDLCTDKEFILTAKITDAVKQYYKDINYLFQWTKDDPSVVEKPEWHDLGSPSTNDAYTFVSPANEEPFLSIANQPKTNFFFRLVVGDKVTLTTDRDWEDMNAQSPCRNVSISDIPIIASLNCAACSHLDFEETGVTFTADNGKFDAKKNIVELCAGESVELGIKDAVHGLDKDGNDYNDYEVKWFKEDVKGTALVTKKCKTDNEDVAPTWTVSYDDVESAGAAGVKYIISFHDYFDPTMATTPCDMTDTIIVIANPKPTDKLKDPAPFCEGTLASEPEKKISGYAIQWFETETDTAKASEIAEPEVVAVTKAESPKSYYYVLTDETTGCRGDANEYVVKVNKAEANNVDNSKMIEYKKADAIGGSLKPLDQQSGSTFKPALSVKDHTLMIGLVEGATDATAPDLATAKFGAASSTIPTPTVKDVNNSDDEYLWYYTYLESKDGCLSDTVLVGVVIKGAPSPITYSAAYCVNSPEVKPMSEYAEPAIEDKNGTLKFYDTDKTTPMDPSDFPAVSTPGKYTYWVSQESSTGGGESSKQPIVIEVYGVNDVELSRTSDKYCKNDQNAKAVDDIVSSVAPSGNNKDYIKSDEWEFFEANEPTLNEKTSGAASTMSVSTSTAGEFKYYARRIYRVDNKLTNSTEVCYGKHVEYTVEIQSVADPITTNVTYLKAEGAPENGGFKKPTEQNPDAVIGDANCTDCSIVWYDENKVQIDESEATPKYNASLEGNEEHKYYVKQVNSLGCESGFNEVMIIVSGYPTPTVKNISVCENSSKLTGTIPAKINETDAAKESDFKLVWYKSNADGTMDESQEFDEIELNPSVQAVESGSEKTEYKYYVLQRLVSSTTKPYAQSAPVPVTVTINAKPRLKELVTAPKCKGESQKLSEMYKSDIDGCKATYYDSNHGSMVEMPSDVVTEAGLYEVKGWYVINKGSSDEEECWSSSQDLTVVFHELDANIVGSDRTCPGVDVNLDADVVFGGGLQLSDVHYAWTNNLNSKTGDQQTYNTGAEGLDVTGNNMKVTLEVWSDACKKSIERTKTHNIKVGDGQLDGKIAFSENNNTETKEEFVSASSIEFNSCGGNVEVKLTGIVNKDGGKYTLSGSSSESGSFSSETDGEATLSLGEGTYTLEYVNECPTKFEFTIHDFSNKASSTNSNMTICEKEKWSAEIVNIEGPKPKIEWQKDGMEIPGETNEKLQFNESKPEDSGVYTYTLYSAGCRFDGKIATGNALKVKPYVVFDESSYEKKYEVVNGEKQDINLGIKVPASVSDIESDIKWTDMNSGFSHEGTGLLIDPVDTDYNLHIVAENKNYCKAETDIVVLVDARLQMTAELERIQICEGETTKLIVDTTGTGNVLHPGDLVLKVTETTIDGDKTINLTPNRSTGKLEAEVNPVHDAKYVVTYTYKVGDQDASKPLELTVHEKFQVEWLPVAPVCQGDAASVEIVKVYPVGTELDWSDNPADEIVSGSISGATFMPIHTGSGVARQTKTYKVIAKNGICQDKPFMINIDVDKPIEGEIMTADKICQYDELSLDASSYQADTYEWKYEEKDSVFTGVTAKLVPDPDYATFTLSMTRGKCSAEVQKYVEVTSAPSVLQVDSIGIRQIEIQMEVGLGTGEFKYIIDGNEDDPEIGNNIRDGLSYSEHVVKVIDEVGCSTEFRFVVNNPAIEIPIHVSPNGDGVSDRFVVKGLAEGYPDAKVTIFDRWGKELASYNAGDGTDWDGVYNGVSMPSTDYWYEIQIKEIKKTYTGHFTLIRQ
ncbi:MAG: T9SS type B sorting domain-containing protein [Paludibacteraceae bacterium]|nr:T9SS type B sorting domain-containing protein [Paludibacteraceae bacterium]